jgi:UDP-N-acetylmuramoyl-L-alanyl-D-glutamate--2,6-diaminopimelate ligase
MRLLTELLAALPDAPKLERDIASLYISSITSDSRQVKKDSLYVALKGVHADGSKFIDDAAAKGAAVIVAAHDAIVPALPAHVLLIQVETPRLALAKMAAAFVGKQPKFIAAITGTDGKTSTAFFTRQLWEKLDLKAASLGTLGLIGDGGKALSDGTHTTPDPVVLHQSLGSLSEEGYTHVAMEASSHGLDQYRLDGVEVSAAAFTNFTRDHLDYHGTLDNYFAAKARLFHDVIRPQGTVIINIEDERVGDLVKIATKRGCQIIEYGEEARHLRILNIEPLPRGQRVSLMVWGKAHEFITPIVGSFQVYNMLAAAGLVIASGYDITKVMSLLPTLVGVRGRLEHVGNHHGAAIYIDYAHTPTALANVLETLRPHTQNKLHVVFGCGGDRDKGKRPEMGSTAVALADCVIVTDDNPRTENPDIIRSEIMAACKGALEIGDRKAAIAKAMEKLQAGDVLLVAGKGHETVQIIGDAHIPFDDAEVIREGMAS